MAAVTAKQIQEMLSRGFTVEEICKSLGISRTTVWRAKKSRPDRVFRSKKKFSLRPFLPHWKKAGEENVYTLFYICLPKWISEKYREGTAEFETAYDILSYGLWTNKKLFTLEGKDFFKYACGYVRRRLYGNFKLWSEAKKKELFSMKDFFDKYSLIY